MLLFFVLVSLQIFEHVTSKTVGSKLFFCFLCSNPFGIVCVCASNPDVFARALEIKAKANKRPRRVGGRNHLTGVWRAWAIHICFNM